MSKANINKDYSNFDYSLNVPPAPTVGVVVLQTDEVLEDELRVWLSNDTRILHTRISSHPEVNTDTLSTMEAALPTSLSLLPNTAPISVIAYGCTSASTVIGEAKVQAIVQKTFPKVKVTNPLSALKAQLDDLGVKRLALLTPYEPVVSDALRKNLIEHGVEVVSFGTFNEPLDSNVCRIDEASIKAAVKQLHDETECDALFASCTNLRTAAWIEDFSKTLGTPVISSNSALSWHINQLLPGNS